MKPATELSFAVFPVNMLPLVVEATMIPTSRLLFAVFSVKVLLVVPAMLKP